MPSEPRGMAIFEIFANRAAAELQRLSAERALVEREAQLRSLLDGVLDAIIDFDETFRVALMNPAAERVFGRDVAAAAGLDVRDLFGDDSRRRLERCVGELCSPAAARRSQWVAGGLGALLVDGRAFQTEATLSCYLFGEQRRLTLILRNVEERIAAEQRIVSLTREAQQLREELGALQSHARIVGSSPALLRTLREVEQVAATEATVLLLGETGTGKELFARAIHGNGKRHDKALVRLNCGAIPHALIESELFGHEKGAFTGATQRREGRFQLAHGGTLFLDEIGELPIDLQPKLLRVLQEGELEPVGSSRTLSVDVRIIAATHRDLAECVRRGTFREDLYYRLSVFPIVIPPLRDRDGDVDELARVFLEKYARQLGRSFSPLSETALARLRDYAWPGNVRELENVIERGVIVSKNGVFDIDRALPRAPVRSAKPDVDHSRRVRTVSELLALERENIERALAQTGGKIAGPQGAAALLGTHPSTLSSRIRALGITRARR
jgi:PAS domain S-box-containing protein